MTHPEERSTEVRQVGSDLTPPSTACVKLKVFYDNNFQQSSGGGEAQVRAVLAAAEAIFKDKFASSNRLGTDITFSYEGMDLRPTIVSYF